MTYCKKKKNIYIYIYHNFSGLWQKPGWAQKGNALNNLKKTENREKIAEGGNLAAPITNIREHMEKK